MKKIIPILLNTNNALHFLNVGSTLFFLFNYKYFNKEQQSVIYLYINKYLPIENRSTSFKICYYNRIRQF